MQGAGLKCGGEQAMTNESVSVFLQSLDNHMNLSRNYALFCFVTPNATPPFNFRSKKTDWQEKFFKLNKVNTVVYAQKQKATKCIGNRLSEYIYNRYVTVGPNIQEACDLNVYWTWIYKKSVRSQEETIMFQNEWFSTICCHFNYTILLHPLPLWCE